MADSNNSGQFGKRSDTEEQAHKGGMASPTKFGSPQGADPHKEGQKGAEAQSTRDKALGGENSHKNR